jgi:hypothetical protein
MQSVGLSRGNALKRLGPLVALTQYVLAIAKHSETPGDEAEKFKQEVRGWLKDLERIDGDRKERYRELGEFGSHAL